MTGPSTAASAFPAGPRRRRGASPSGGVRSARDVALTVLERCDARTPVQAALDREMRASGLEGREAAQAAELSYGVLRAEPRLVRLLGLVLRAPDKLPLRMRRVLALAAYELLHLDGVPEYAAVDAAVSTVRRQWGKGLGGVANAALRALIRLRPELSPDFLAARFPDPAECLAARHGLPPWIGRLWLRAFGPERTERLAEASARTPWACVRINAARAGADALRQRLLAAGGVPAGDRGLAFAPGRRPDALTELQAQGLLSLQGSGSQNMLHTLDAAHWESPFWDACAGRGGKTCALLEAGLRPLAASDVSAHRLEGLRRDVRRLGLEEPPVFLGSAVRAPLASGSARTVLLDVPCSGLGTLARRPDLRRLRRPEHTAPLRELQAAILNEAWRVVAPGGRIAYITCTINPEENEDRIAAFLNAHPAAELIRRHSDDPDGTGADLLFGALLRKPC